MPAQPRKAAPRKSTAASVAARREVRAEKGTVKPVTVTFRGVKFEIPRDRLASIRVYMRQRHAAQFPSGESLSSLLFEILGSANSAGFIDLLVEGDTIAGSASEFFDLVNKAAGHPNS